MPFFSNSFFKLSAFAFDLFESQPNIQGIRTEEDMQKFNAINLEFNLAKFGLGNENVTIITASNVRMLRCLNVRMPKYQKPSTILELRHVKCGQ